MIFLEVYLALLALAAVFTVYAFWDINNRVYGNIASAVLAGITFPFLSAMNILGMVNIGSVSVASITAVTNGTETTSTYTYADPTTVFQSAPLMWVEIVVGIVVLLIAVLLALDALSEGREEEAEEM